MEIKSKTLDQSSSHQRRLLHHQISVFLLTFFAYASFHASRKPPSIVKSVLGPEVSESRGDMSGNDTGWAPFNGTQGIHRLGEIDLAFLSAYSVGMYFAGHIGDRVDLRLFLAFGMLGSAVSTVAFGLAFWLKIHHLGYFLAVQIVSGLFQSTGWPCVVSVVGHWFGKSKRGLIMGLWNSHTSFGNIFGSIVAASALGIGWGWSFVFPGILIGLVGLLVHEYLIVSPEAAGFELKEVELNSQSETPEMTPLHKEEEEEEERVLLQVGDGFSESAVAIGFIDAWNLPGVASYAFCLFFSKLVAYTFLYWLPFYIRHTAIAGAYLSHRTAGMLSSVFDLGGVVGGILAGYISDAIEARGVTSVIFLLLSIPALIFYRIYGSVSSSANVGLMFLSGLFVNGPYSLITTAVAADLGTQSLIQGNSRSLATVTAIIDGTGSVGAALGPLLTGYISTRGWNSVFGMLIVAIVFASLFLVHIAKAEITSKWNEGKWFWQRINSG
ncbi:putative glycerol-3-phosphate transporter 5 [Aristolochia californica]|uniref:putative glycerol-3-phosphate transporter 5 n=1 Tax=Aristolochia californica TaxID=171875 RepID=UPI0035DBD5BF